MNEESINDKIKSFFDYFESAVDEADRFPQGVHSLTHKKIVLVSLIDSLSKTVYPKKSNKVRFTSVIKEFGGWADCERISLPHLAQLLIVNPDPEFSDLRKLCFPIIEPWKKGGPHYLNEDLEFNVIRSKWPKDKDLLKTLEKTDFEELKHINLIYRYRNSLIHEHRRKDFIEAAGDSKPFYLTVSGFNGGIDNVKWMLIYPGPFFVKLAKTIISNLRAYFLANNLNPRLAYDKGIYWLEGLDVE